MNHSSLMLSSEVEKYLRHNTFMFNHFKTKQVYKYINDDEYYQYKAMIHILQIICQLKYFTRLNMLNSKYITIYRKFKYDYK